MNVTITENPTLDDIEVAIACPHLDERVQRIVASLGAFDRLLVGSHDGTTYRVPADDVLYAETVDGATFLYTKEIVLETPLRLYELEDELFRHGVRAGVEADARELRPRPRHQALPERPPAASARQRRSRHRVRRQYAPAIKRKPGPLGP